jgi:peptidoglycan L-alanyl-D-glutamate endopeptidase CwlK
MGQMHLIMLDFQWNAMEEGKGYGELSLPMYDRKMWEGGWFEAPTLRGVVDIAFQVVGTVTGIPALSLAGNLLFAGFDLGGGYKSAAEVGLELAKAGATVAISYGVGALGGKVFGTAEKMVQTVDAAGNTVMKKAAATGVHALTGVGGVAARAGAAGAAAYVSGVATSAVNSIQLNAQGNLSWNWETFNNGVNSAGISALSSIAASFTTGIMGEWNTGTNGEKLAGFNRLSEANVGKLNSLAGSLVGQGVEYAFTGDYTFNVLNTGLFTNGAVNVGLLELHLGSETSMKLGTGGANVSIDNLAAAINGAMVWNANTKVDKYINDNSRSGDFDANVALRALSKYGYGDADQHGLFNDILSGDVRLLTGAEGDHYAETVTFDNGKRFIELTEKSFSSGMSAEDQMLLAVILGHEAYRDGIVTADNYLETRTAVTSHTEMAIRMLMEGRDIKFDSNLARDMLEYVTGTSEMFNAYVDANYDSSADYWKLAKDANGVWGWEEDGSYDFNFDMTDKEISSAFYNIINPNNPNKPYEKITGEKIPNYTYGAGDIATIKFSDMTASFAEALGRSLGINDPSGVRISAADASRNMALDDFVNRTMALAAAEIKAREISANNTKHLNSMHPDAKGLFTDFIVTLQRQGIDVNIGESLRSIEKQNDYWQKGRDDTLGQETKTDAKGGYSYHNYGWAIDVDIYNVVNGKRELEEPHKPTDVRYQGSNWQKTVTIAESMGFEAGYLWKSRFDPWHFEYRILDIYQLKELYDDGKVKNGYVILPK